MVMGHEFAGVVSAVGDGVTNVTRGRPGRRRALLTCAASAPPARPAVTTSAASSASSGSTASRAASPRSASSTPAGSTRSATCPTDLGALVEPLAVAYHAVRLSGIKPGGTAAVFGSGPIGLVTTAALKAAGAGRR